ncbi:tRNA (adenosine(37)-N6)-threonylcarbamoyltransferase complex dimerization subunit type 1 TsaB [Hydrogenophaga sp. 5NK40-0174]|uniref:tRNA (adenosine(37)-N6)-threonylcarbamoyltransferase complex dimerization subunit type 1 TsaB n=1 Tax=Hydrogenophaga sp. 5NK40-0174 TaxID=3127649 RepID=UPI0033407377
MTVASSERRFLSIESSTDVMSVALGSGVPGERVWVYRGPGAAQSSLHLLPQVRALLAESGWALSSLDAVVYGRGPGSFTGLRTACAVAQGLALGAGLPVIGVDTLMTLAQQAAVASSQAGQVAPSRVTAVLDARMNEVYVAQYARPSGEALWQTVSPPQLCAPRALAAHVAAITGDETHAGLRWLVGNARKAYPDALDAVEGQWLDTVPDAEAMLSLAPSLLAAGLAEAAEQAQPVYVRDKVAQTTAEREAQRAKAEQA